MRSILAIICSNISN